MKSAIGSYYIASGALFAVAFVVPWAYLAFLPAFILLYIGIRDTQTYRGLFLWGTATGTLIYLGSFYWVWSTLPIIWMQGQPFWIQVGAVGIYWVLTSLAMGIGCGLFTLAVKRSMSNPFVFMVCAPVLWVASEIIKSLSFAIYSAGEGSFISADFSFGYVGYLLSEHSGFLQFSVLGGAYVLSFVTALLGALGYLIVQQKLYTKVYVLGACFTFLILVFGTASGMSVHSYQQQGLTVIGIDTRFDKFFTPSESTKEIKRTALKEAFEVALTHDPDVIITPEDARLSDAFDSQSALFAWVKERTERPVIIIDNGQAYDARGKFVIRTYIYDTQTESVYFFDKRYLVPQGEFMSYLHLFLIDLYADDATMTAIQESVRAHSGVVTDSNVLPARIPGVLFCFETMVPLSVYKAEQIREHPFIAHSISHSWFTQPDALEYQLDAMMKVHAVWNNIPIVSAGNMVEGKHYTPEGTIEQGEILYEDTYTTLQRFSL